MAVDYLYQSIHPITGTVTTYYPLDGEFDLSIDRNDATYTVLGVDGGIDPLAGAAFQLNPRKVKVKFTKPYFSTTAPFAITGSGSAQSVQVGSTGTMQVGESVVVDPTGNMEIVTITGLTATTITGIFAKSHSAGATIAQNSTTIRDQYMAAFGHGLNQQIVWKTANGTYRYGWAKCIGIPQTHSVQTTTFITYDLTFVMSDPLFYDQYPAGWKLWDDSTLAWDQTGLSWDNNPDFLAVTGLQTLHTITNGGTAPVRNAVFDLTGPIPGPIAIANHTIPVANTYMAVGYNGSLGYGERLQIDLGKSSITKNGVSVYPSIYFGDPSQTEWMRFDVGANSLYLISGATGPTTFSGSTAGAITATGTQTLAVPAGTSSTLSNAILYPNVLQAVNVGSTAGAATGDLLYLDSGGNAETIPLWQVYSSTVLLFTPAKAHAIGAAFTVGKFAVGDTITIDSGANAETVMVTAVIDATHVQATFTKTHAAGVAFTSTHFNGHWTTTWRPPYL